MPASGVLDFPAWPFDADPVVIECCRFDDDLDAQRIETVAQGIQAPLGIASGSARWREWVLGRVLVQRAAQRAGVSSGIVDATDSGAPRLREGHWSVSIAHTTGLVVAAVAPMPVGIDVERRDRDVTRLMRSFSPAEHDVAVSLGPIRALVAKEAAAKATELGLGGSLTRWPLIDAELCGDAPTVSIASPDERIVDVRMFDAWDYVVGVAVIPRPRGSFPTLA